MGEITTTTSYATKKIANELEISVETVRDIIEKFLCEVVGCLKQEMPFNISGFGKFYFMYRQNTRLSQRAKDPSIYEGKVHREIKFQIASIMKNKVNGWVHDLGLRNNIDKKEMMRLAIRPEEISKMRRSRILEEQRNVGFRSELLFDEDNLPDHDRDVATQINDAPTLNEILERLGVNIESRS